MTRKDIYVFKAKFGVGNFEIEVYKLPVKKETAKAYFVKNIQILLMINSYRLFILWISALNLLL